jgi:hypothetical protein
MNADEMTFRKQLSLGHAAVQVRSGTGGQFSTMSLPLVITQTFEEK